MPKVSFAAAEQYTPNAGFTEGWGEVKNAVSCIYQYPPNRDTGEQLAPFLAVVLTIQRTDESGNPTEDEPLQKVLRVEKDTAKMRPGRVDSRDDQNPEDCGDELDVEGNTIFAEEGAKINRNCTWATFSRSLEERGFKASILHEAYLPDLIGLRFHAVNQKGQKSNINGREVEANYLVVDKITAFPGEQAAKKAPAKKPAASAASSKANGVPAVAANGAANGHAAATASGDAESTAAAIVRELATELGGETRDTKKFYAMAYSRLIQSKNRDKKQDKAVQDFLRNDQWLIEQAAELQFDFDGETFTFPAAAA